MQKLHKLFYPESVAVAGVSHRVDNMASMILRNLSRWGYPGKVYGINPQCEGEIHGARVYPSLDKIPGPVDALIILSPARTIPDLLDQCAAKGVRHAIIESAGFSEYGESGAVLGELIKEKAAKHGIVFTGPNGLGVISAEQKFCTPFSSIDPFPPGNVSILSQSGGVGLSIVAGLAEHNLAANKFVSMGNKYSLDECDYLEYLIGDPGTEIILMFLESVADGRRLCELAASARKPVIVYKGNTTEAGQKRALSHTGSLANNDAVLDAAFKQAGIIRVNDISALVHCARMFTQPPMRGARLVAISPAGGFSVISADECSRAGFTFPALTEKTLKPIRERLRAGVINIANPLDLGDALTSDALTMSLRQALKQDDIDAALIVLPRRHSRNYTGAFAAMQTNIVPEIQDAIKKSGKPAVAVFYAMPDVITELRGDSTVPVFGSIVVAVRAMSAFLQHSQRNASAGDKTGQSPKTKSSLKRKSSNTRKISDATGKPTAARKPSAPTLPPVSRTILNTAENGLLASAAAFDLLYSVGIQAPPCAEAETAAEAVAAARKLKYPVAMKISSPALSHKSDAGGVILGIANDADALKAAAQLQKIIKTKKLGGNIFVQKMAPPGVELIIGARRDPSFGPVIVAGMGGVFVEIMKDTAVRLAPVVRQAALEMLRSLSGSALLLGARGAKPADIESAAAAIVALSRLIAAAPDIEELDINPLVVTPDCALAVDARIVISNEVG